MHINGDFKIFVTITSCALLRQNIFNLKTQQVVLRTQQVVLKTQQDVYL